MAFTGLRFGEVTALRWDDVDEAAGVLHVRGAQWQGHVDTTKTGVERQVPLTPELVEAFRTQRGRLLRKQHPGLAAGWVFPARAQRRRAGAPAAVLMHNTAPRKAIAACLEAAKIDRNFSVHGFRHTLNNLVRRVAHGEVVRAITGHSDQEMTFHYAHVAADEKRAAIASVVALVRRAETTAVHPSGNQSGNEPVRAAEAAT